MQQKARTPWNPNDRYHPSPILDDFSAKSEGLPPKLDRKLYEKELARLQVELVIGWPGGLVGNMKYVHFETASM